MSTTEQVQVKRKRGRPRLEIPEPSPQLQKLIDEAKTHYEKGSVLLPKIYSRAREENYTPKQAYALLRQITEGKLSPRQLRRVIPKEAKMTQRTSKRSLTASANKASRQETVKTQTKEEVATTILAELTDVMGNPALGALGKVRAVARIIHRIDQEGTLGTS